MVQDSLIYVAWTVVIAAVLLALCAIIYVIVQNHRHRKREDAIERDRKKYE
jgi:hypothetical protein